MKPTLMYAAVAVALALLPARRFALLFVACATLASGEVRAQSDAEPCNWFRPVYGQYYVPGDRETLERWQMPSTAWDGSGAEELLIGPPICVADRLLQDPLPFEDDDTSLFPDPERDTTPVLVPCKWHVRYEQGISDLIPLLRGTRL